MPTADTEIKITVEKTLNDGTKTHFPLSEASDRIVAAVEKSLADLIAPLEPDSADWLRKAYATNDPAMRSAYLSLARGDE